MSIIRSLTKKELRQILSHNGKPLTQYYFNQHFRNDIIKLLKLDDNKYAKKKSFNFEETQLIIQFYKIEATELEIN